MHLSIAISYLRMHQRVGYGVSYYRLSKKVLVE